MSDTFYEKPTHNSSWALLRRRKEQWMLCKQRSYGYIKISRNFSTKYHKNPPNRPVIDRWYDDYRTQGTNQQGGGNWRLDWVPKWNLRFSKNSPTIRRYLFDKWQLSLVFITQQCKFSCWKSCRRSCIICKIHIKKEMEI